MNSLFARSFCFCLITICGFSIANAQSASGHPLRVLCVGAHPDDPESGCGGTLLRYIETGAIDPTFVVTHRVSLEEAPEMYRTFRDKQDGCVKVVMKPH